MKWVPRFACALMLFPTANSAADRAEALFSKANAFYQKGEYDSAERCYRQLVDAGTVTGPICYNLGNACFKQKKLGEAIYYWEKAREELPGDSEVRENLDFANLLVVDRIEAVQDPLAVRAFHAAVHSLTPRRESILALILFVAANALFAVYLLSAGPRMAWRSLLASLVLCLAAALLACSLGWKLYEKNHRQQGIIIEQVVEVRSGPGTENIAVATVHEGIKVSVRGELNGWYQISLPNGWNGWLRRDALRIL
jgi:tetratricopeptide (TPR) repeat protein